MERSKGRGCRWPELPVPPQTTKRPASNTSRHTLSSGQASNTCVNKSNIKMTEDTGVRQPTATGVAAAGRDVMSSLACRDAVVHVASKRRRTLERINSFPGALVHWSAYRTLADGSGWGSRVVVEAKRPRRMKNPELLQHPANSTQHHLLACSFSAIHTFVGEL